MSDLATKREVFWETRTTGSAIIWQNLKLACESMINHDMELATSVLQAVGLRTGGDLSHVYDTLGNAYQIPKYCFSTPSNVISDAAAAIALASRRSLPHQGSVLPLDIILRLSQNGSASREQDICLAPGVCKSSTTAEQLKEALHEALARGSHDITPDECNPRPNIWKGGGLPPLRQKLLFRGRIIENQSHMQEAGVKSGDIVQVFVLPPP